MRLATGGEWVRVMSGVSVGQVGLERGGAEDVLARTGAGGSLGEVGGFGGALDGALRRVDSPARNPVATDEAYQKTHEAAEELVSGALVKPILAELRETNQAAPPFAPGRWEKTFGPLLDEEISARIVRSSRFPLVETMTRQLLSRDGLQGVIKETSHG